MFKETALCMVLIWLIWGFVLQSFNGSGPRGTGHHGS